MCACVCTCLRAGLDGECVGGGNFAFLHLNMTFQNGISEFAMRTKLVKQCQLVIHP